MSEYSSSDESLDTEDLNEINGTEDQVYEEVQIKSVERTKQVQKVAVPKKEKVEKTETEPVAAAKPKKRELSAKQRANIDALVKRNKERAVVRKQARDAGKILDEKPLGRKPKPKQEVIVNKEIQKIIYMIPDGQGGFEKHLNAPRVSKKNAQYFKNLEAAEKEEVLAGKMLLKTKKGKVDARQQKGRTEKQKVATLALVERNRKRREASQQSKNQHEQQKMEQIKDQVHNTIIDVVTTPAAEMKKKERIIQRPAITEEDRQAAKERKIKDLFS